MVSQRTARTARPVNHRVRREVRMLFRIFGVFPIVIFCLSHNSIAFACKPVDLEYLRSYWTINPDDVAKKESFIANTAYSHDNSYDPEYADEMFIKILLDAAQSGVKKHIIKGTLIEYNCMYHARDLPEYEKLKKLFPTLFVNKCNEKKYLNTYFVISDNGAYIRSKASKNSKIIRAIPEGQLVELIGTNGNWMLITSDWGRGYIHKSLLTKY